MTGLIVILTVTAYFAGALAAAPKLMRLIYQEKLAVLAEAQAQYDKDLARYKEDRRGAAYPPMELHRTARDARIDARAEGFWWSLVWPFALAFHALGATAFADEIAAQAAAANTKIIRDYEKLIDARFDEELATTVQTKSGPFRIQRFFKEKH